MLCGEIKTETLSATGHKYGAWKTISIATVFAPAKQTRHCSVCSKSETRTYGSKLRTAVNPFTCTTKVKYKSSNSKIAKVTSKGKITAGKKKGKAKRNADYLAMIDKSIAEAEAGGFITKTIAELEALE